MWLFKPVLGLYLLHAAFLYSTATADSTKCSKPNRGLDMDECLLSLKGQLFNTTAYWFGVQYKEDCPNGAVEGDIFCAAPGSGQGKTLAHRLFPNGLDYNFIDRFLEVTYSYGAGSYTGCGYEVHEPSWERDIDPLSGDRITAWNTRLMPDLRFHAMDSEYFTIIFYDVGNLLPHAVFVNVHGNNITEDNVVKAYHGPVNPLTRPNPYMFMLFTQQGELAISQQWKEISNTNTNGGFKIREFADAHNLSGPVGVNWVTVVGDLYSAGLAASREWMYTCPLFVSQAIDMQEDPPAFLSRPESLSVAVNVEYRSPQLSFELCGQEQQFEAVNVTVDPFSNNAIFTGSLRTASDQLITFRRVGFYDDSEDFDDMYALVLVNPDFAINNESGSQLLQFVVNIMDGNVSTGDVILSYAGLTPCNNDVLQRDPVICRYYFLLYKQTGSLDVGEESYNETYIGACNGTDLRYCHFNITQLVEDEDLQLVGANFFSTQFDDYADFLTLTALNNTNTTHEYCCGGPEKAEYCPTEPMITTTPENSAPCLIHSGVIATYIVTILAVALL